MTNPASTVTDTVNPIVDTLDKAMKKARPAKPAVVVDLPVAPQVKATVVKVKAKPAAVVDLPVAPQSGQVFRVDPASIIVEKGYNVRTFDAANGKGATADQLSDYNLKRSILFTGGISTPVTVRHTPEGLVLMGGHRRLAATLDLAKEYPGKKAFATIPVMLAGGTQNHLQPMRDRDLFVSNSGKPLSPWERATVAKRLADAGEKPAHIATLAGCTTRYVGMLLDMAQFPPAVAEWLVDELITPTLAAELVKELDGGDYANPVHTIRVVQAALDHEIAKHGYGATVKVSRSKIDATMARLADEKPAKAKDAAGQVEGAADGEEGQGEEGQGDETPVIFKLSANGSKIFRNRVLWLTIAAKTPEEGAAEAKRLLPMLRKALSA